MMTSTLEPPLRSRHPAAAGMPSRRPGRMTTVVVLIVSLLASGALREIVAARQARLVNLRGSATGRSTLGNMDSFALALLLGGLRGPLIMFLWPAIENQKADHNLQDVDTMIEWVRLLQPEFDTVHMFQIWNKAYNLSAMMASPANKYVVIMEAVDYAERVDQERPGDINILGAMSNVYSGKLGSKNLPEFDFYGRQFREESLTEANRLIAYPEEARRFQRLYTKAGPLLDDNNNIRKELLAPTRSRPDGKDAGEEWNDGSALQYLAAFGPFPYGVSPLAMGYNYAKRAEVAQSAEGQKPLQLSAMVIDSQPAIQLKFWEEDDSLRGRRNEARAFGIAGGGNIADSESSLASLAPGTSPTDRNALNAAMWYYATAEHVATLATAEYERHLAKPEYVLRRGTYRSHLADMAAGAAMNKADHEYLQAVMTPDGPERSKLLRMASDDYYKAMILSERVALEFYTEDIVLWASGPGIPGGSVMPPAEHADPNQPPDKERIFKLDENRVNEVYEKAMRLAVSLPQNRQEHADDRLNLAISVGRCQTRISVVNAALKSSR